MNTKRILKSIGMFFIFITISAGYASAETASGKSKNSSSQQIENQTKKGEEITVYARGTSYYGDTETVCGVSPQTVRAIGLVPIAVDENVVPYGSKIEGVGKDGGKIKGVAVDKGSAVTSRKAAKKLALIKGYSTQSPEYNAPVFDFYAPSDITHYWSNFKVVLYKGKPFKDMKYTEKIAHLQQIKKGG